MFLRNAFGYAPLLLALLHCESASTNDHADEAGADGGPAADPASWTKGACAPPAVMVNPPAKLSDTGCMDARDPTKFAALVVPYEVQSPLWSDAADKARGFVLPPAGKIHVKDCVKSPDLCAAGPADTGKWVFPAGTVMVKSFLFKEKLVETRLFVQFGDGTWVGYSYQWDEAQTDAVLLPDARTSEMFDTGQGVVAWSFPDRLQCMTCHNMAGGPTLGPETAQMNRVVGGTNQIDKFQAMGLFDAVLATPYKDALVTPYAGQLGSPPAGATVDARARSYLHANCAFCHRPDATFPNFDVRFDVPLKDTNLCNVVPAKGDQGVAGAVELAPGHPEVSVLWLRMGAASMGQGRMPPIASAVVDDAGVALVGDWITSLTCPM